MSEDLLALVVSVLSGLYLSGLGWAVILARLRLTSWRKAWWAFQPVGLGSVVFAAYVVAVPLFDRFGLYNLKLPFCSAGLLVVLIPLLAPSLTWRRVAGLSSRPPFARRAAMSCLKFALAILLVVWLPFGLWALGIIPFYEVASAVAGLAALLVLLRGTVSVWRMSYAATLPETC